jgi:hypothetical protein
MRYRKVQTVEAAHRRDHEEADGAKAPEQMAGPREPVVQDCKRPVV